MKVLTCSETHETLQRIQLWWNLMYFMYFEPWVVQNGSLAKCSAHDYFYVGTLILSIRTPVKLLFSLSWLEPFNPITFEKLQMYIQICHSCVDENNQTSTVESGDNVVLYQPLEALHHDEGECYRAVIIEGEDCGFFSHRYNCSSL